MFRNAPALFIILGSSLGSYGPLPAASLPDPYRPANYFTQGLTIFDGQGKGKTPGISFGAGARVVFGPDGRALYSTEWPRGLTRFDLVSRRATHIQGSDDFQQIFDFAVTASEERLIVAGTHSSPKGTTCGIFEVDTNAGSVRHLLGQTECRYVTSWSDISLSPSGLEAVARHDKRVELLDFSTATSRPLASSQYETAAWSPDGRWIAVLDKSRSPRLFLLDANDFSRRKSFGPTDGGLEWSPDSRHLLLVKEQLRCGLLSYSYSMETVDIATGKRSVVKDSQCKIIGGPSGWIEANILK